MIITAITSLTIPVVDLEGGKGGAAAPHFYMQQCTFHMHGWAILDQAMQ